MLREVWIEYNVLSISMSEKYVQQNLSKLL